MNLSDFHDSIKNCQRCILHQARTQVVPGEGNFKANIMFIGEAPGQKEDKQGQPFVGASGKLLNEMLASINLNRSDVFIANTVKCRPPANRDPLPLEIATCLPYLKEQIKIIQPKIIVTLGRFALHLFFPDMQIGQCHGQIMIKNSLKVLALYHPASALYNGKMKTILFNDFQTLNNFVNIN